MAEVDYQMALLLQYKFEQEHKRKENTNSDHQLALELQEQFKTEIEVERPTNNLVYKASTNNNSKCLVDPSWEVIDPTPDVHVLFIAFSQKFFWNSLGSVTVSWSKRMTTCAGICSYQGTGGLCSITLSEPLLKLRPRKDLVETLLHEMIHAYLFVTNNNKDRDGHGPEFHKHMYRINAEAGTNITVYHDFHDEVKLYLQHWWRCDGPCQNWQPYFGIIRRATNRAPGPNNPWWDGHMRNCGGSFIKVKSPEKPEKEAKKADPPKETNPKNDIRNYITSSSGSKTLLPTTNKTNTEKLVNPVVPNRESKPTSTISQGTDVTTSALPNNIRTVSNSSSSNPQISNVVPSNTNNIFGFTNLGGSTTNSKRPCQTSGVKGGVKNAGSNTFVVTKKGSNNTTNIDSNSTSERVGIRAADIQAFSGTGRSLSSGNLPSSSNGDYSVVRDHWLKKFDNTSRRNSVKRLNSPDSSHGSPKFPKLANNDSQDDNKVECPVCTGKFKPEDLNDHLDSCLETSPSDDGKECIICGMKIPTLDFEKHVTDCTAKHFGDFDNEVEFLDECPICTKSFNPKTDTKHIETCRLTKRVDPTSSSSAEESKNCPVCKKALSAQGYNIHVQHCILTMCDEFDEKYDVVQNPKTACLACGNEILKSELNSHLEDCMSMSNVFDTSNVQVENRDDMGNNIDNSEITLDISYNCPYCLILVLETEMQAHLHRCLNAEDNVEKNSLLFESFYNTDLDMN